MLLPTEPSFALTLGILGMEMPPDEDGIASTGWLTDSLGNLSSLPPSSGCRVLIGAV